MRLADDLSGGTDVATAEVPATVVQGYPILVLVDGTTAPCPALILSNVATSMAEGFRVRVRVRNPYVPYVLGYEIDGSGG